MLASKKHPVYMRTVTSLSITANNATNQVDYLKRFGLWSKNIIWELKGATPNHEILEYYKNIHVDLFIQLSRTEGGVPVSMQEAASFGIPLLGTNTGGIPEIIKENGWLVDVSASAQEISKIINNIIDQKHLLFELRNNSKNFFKIF